MRTSQRAVRQIELRERAEFWLRQQIIAQRTRGHRASPPQGCPGSKCWSEGGVPGTLSPTRAHRQQRSGSVCAWPGETGDPWGYEAAANFLTLTLPHTSDRVPVQAPARTNHSQDGQRGGACDAAQIPAPWGLNLPGSACALQQVLLVHGLHAASPSAPSKLRAGR